MFEVNLNQAKQFVIECFEANLVPQLLSSPGIGKSSIVKELAKEYSLELIDLRLSQIESVDLLGFPVTTGNKAKYLPFDTFPLEEDSIPQGKNGWILFLDELPLASKEVQRAAYRLILDREVGQYKLHENVYIVAAGNLMTDRALVQPLSTAIESRIIDILIKPDLNTLISNVAIPNRWDERVIAYLQYAPDKLMTFDPNSTEKKYACPRTWEFVSKLIKSKEVSIDKLALLVGTVGSVASDFVSFCSIYGEVPTINEILNNPLEVPVPNSVSLRYATITHLSQNVKEDTLNDVFKYVNRFSADMRVLFFRLLVIKDKNLVTHPVFAEHMVEFSKHVK